MLTMRKVDSSLRSLSQEAFEHTPSEAEAEVVESRTLDPRALRIPRQST